MAPVEYGADGVHQAAISPRSAVRDSVVVGGVVVTVERIWSSVYPAHMNWARMPLMYACVSRAVVVMLL